MTPKESEEIKNQGQELLDKGLIREILSPSIVPIVLSLKKDGGWRMCIVSRYITKSQSSTNFHYPILMI